MGGNNSKPVSSQNVQNVVSSNNNNNNNCSSLREENEKLQTINQNLESTIKKLTLK